MAPEASIHGDSNDTSAFLQDLKHRYRYLHELERQLNALSDSEAETSKGEALLKGFSQAFADVMSREAFVQDLCRNGEHLLPSRPLGRA